MTIDSWPVTRGGKEVEKVGEIDRRDEKEELLLPEIARKSSAAENNEEERLTETFVSVFLWAGDRSVTSH